MLIEATSLTKDFPRARKGSRVFTAVAPLDLALEAGQLTVITGHSGSGKSTLLSMLAGMLPPTAGTVRLGEADLYAMRDEERSHLRNERIGLSPAGAHGAAQLERPRERAAAFRALCQGRAAAARAEELLGAEGSIRSGGRTPQ